MTRHNGFCCNHKNAITKQKRNKATRIAAAAKISSPSAKETATTRRSRPKGWNQTIRESRREQGLICSLLIWIWTFRALITQIKAINSTMLVQLRIRWQLQPPAGRMLVAEWLRTAAVQLSIAGLRRLQKRLNQIQACIQKNRFLLIISILFLIQFYFN